jgi:hypothetical protein
MRKLFALLIVAGTFAFVSCEKKEQTSGMDSAANVVEQPVDTTATAPAADSTAMPADTMATTK